jgi:hypothetical protein
MLVDRFAAKLAARCKVRPGMRPLPLQRRRSSVIAFPILLLAMYWIGPIRLPLNGAWTMPPSGTQALVAMAVTLAWLGSVGPLAGLCRRIDREVHG